jgi:hypothetical protein
VCQAACNLTAQANRKRTAVDLQGSFNADSDIAQVSPLLNHRGASSSTGCSRRSVRRFPAFIRLRMCSHLPDEASPPRRGVGGEAP